MTAADKEKLRAVVAGTVESSRAMRVVRTLSNESVVCRLGRAVVRTFDQSISARSSFLGSWLARWTPATRQFPLTVELASSSAIMRGIEQVFINTERAWNESRLRQIVAQERESLAPSQQAQTLGLVVFVAALAHAALTASALFSSPGATVAWLTLVAVSLLLLARGELVVAAWRSARVRGLSRTPRNRTPEVSLSRPGRYTP